MNELSIILKCMIRLITILISIFGFVKFLATSKTGKQTNCAILNRNEKKTKQVSIQLPNIARTLSDAKKIIKKKILSSDHGDNPIYLI